MPGTYNWLCVSFRDHIKPNPHLDWKILIFWPASPPQSFSCESPKKDQAHLPFLEIPAEKSYALAWLLSQAKNYLPQYYLLWNARLVTGWSTLLKAYLILRFWFSLHYLCLGSVGRKKLWDYQGSYSQLYNRRTLWDLWKPLVITSWTFVVSWCYFQDGHQAQNANKWKLAYARIFHMFYSRIKDVRILLSTNS